MKIHYLESYCEIMLSHALECAMRKRIKWCKRRADLYLQPYESYQTMKIGTLKALGRVRAARSRMGDPRE